MKLYELNTETAILAELGQRLAQMRVNLNLTQADTAEQAGLSKPTLERIEAGKSARMDNMIRLLRVLGLLELLDQLIPEPGPRPLDLLKRHGKGRKRASTVREPKPGKAKWNWRDKQ